MEFNTIAEATPEKEKVKARAQFGEIEYEAHNLEYAKENADRAIRLNYNKVTPEKQSLINDFKKAYASLYVELDLAEGKISWGARKAINAAKEHLQLASYYTVHALTSK